LGRIEGKHGREEGTYCGGSEKNDSFFLLSPTHTRVGVFPKKGGKGWRKGNPGERGILAESPPGLKGCLGEKGFGYFKRNRDQENLPVTICSIRKFQAPNGWCVVLLKRRGVKGGDRKMRGAGNCSI